MWYIWDSAHYMQYFIIEIIHFRLIILDIFRNNLYARDNISRILTGRHSGLYVL